jgi:hypothetical protein
MLFTIDDSEVVRIDQRLREDRLAFAGAKHAFREQCTRTLTRPSTLALLLVVGGLAGARSKTPAAAPERRRGTSMLGAVFGSLWVPLVKSLTAIAVQRALRARDGARTRPPHSNGTAWENGA